jgi:hypothetical protein
VNDSPPAAALVRTVSSISTSVAIPGDMMIGFAVRATFASSGKPTFSNEAIPYAGTVTASRKSTAESPNGDEDRMSLSSLG